MSTGSRPPLPNLVTGRAKPPSVPGDPHKGISSLAQASRDGGMAPTQPRPPWDGDTLHPIAPGRLSRCQADVSQPPTLPAGNTLSPGSISIRGGDQMLVYVSPINGSLQHRERRRKPQAVHREVCGVEGVCPSPGTTKPSSRGGPLQRRDVRIKQGNSSTGAHRQIHRPPRPQDLARHPPTYAAPVGHRGAGMGWDEDSPCPSSWVGRGKGWGHFGHRGVWRGWSYFAMGYPTTPRSRVSLPAPIPAMVPFFSPH